MANVIFIFVVGLFSLFPMKHCLASQAASKPASMPDQRLILPTAQSLEPKIPTCGFKDARFTTKAKGELYPNLTQKIASAKFPIVVHYDQHSAGDYPHRILSFADTTWQKLFVEIGFYPPHADGNEGGGPELDIYLDPNLPAGVGGFTGFHGYNLETSREDAIGYVVLRSDLKDEYIRGFVAHEMFHASQMAYDWWENLSFMEGTAVWATEQVFGDENFFWRFFPFYNRKPYLPIDTASILDPFPYGSGMLHLFLEQKFGKMDGAVMKNLWEATVQDSIVNEPDYLDAIASLFGSVTDVFREFGVWRTLVGNQHRQGFFKEGKTWDRGVEPFQEATVSTAMAAVTGQTSFGVGTNAHAIFALENRLNQKGRHFAEFSVPLGASVPRGDKFSSQVIALTADAARLGPVKEFSVGQPMSLTLDYAGDESKLLIIITRSSEEYDPETSSKIGIPIDYKFWK
jgi:hypothetical protein